MAKIVESLKRLSVEHGPRKHDNNRTAKRKGELTLSIEKAVALDHNYILGICGTQSEPEFRIGTALSDYTCVIYSVGESLTETITLTHNRAPVVGIRFSPTSRNILYTATSNGQITACDLRARGKVVAEFKDSTEGGKLKPLSSFDISCDDRLIAGGTEHVGGDAFILFWDIRHSNSKLDDKNNLLGGYWESHMEDVTSLAFHTSKQDVLASGSTDGLINVFDLTQPSEDSALTYSLNTESSVDRIGWLNDDNLWCTTHMHSLQLWNCDGATPYAKFERSSLALFQRDRSSIPTPITPIGAIGRLCLGADSRLLTRSSSHHPFFEQYTPIGPFSASRKAPPDFIGSQRVKVSSNLLEVGKDGAASLLLQGPQLQNDDPNSCYTVRVHASNTLEQPFLLAGSSSVKGENLRCLNVVNGRLEAYYNMAGNKQIVRDSWLHEKSGSLITVGEGGLINVWRQAEATLVEQNSSHKLIAKIGTGKGRDRQHRSKPY